MRVGVSRVSREWKSKYKYTPIGYKDFNWSHVNGIRSSNMQDFRISFLVKTNTYYVTI